MTLEAGELHARDHEGFLSEVHSFEFWFQSVEGYLHGHPHGVSPSTPLPELASDRRAALVATLSTYCVGELTALEGASGMIGFGENALGRHLARRPDDRRRLREVRQTLEPLVFATFEDAALQVGLPATERPEIARLYLDSVARLGLGA